MTLREGFTISIMLIAIGILSYMGYRCFVEAGQEITITQYGDVKLWGKKGYLTDYENFFNDSFISVNEYRILKQAAEQEQFKEEFGL